MAAEQATHSTSIGLGVSSVLFGLVHFASPTYAILSTAAGVFFGLEFIWSGSNVLVPSITHALYDFLFVLVVIRTRL